MKVNNSIAKNVLAKAEDKTPKMAFSAVLGLPQWKNLLKESFASEASQKNFRNALISIVNESNDLQECEPGSIIAAALKGESTNLSLVLKQFYVVPYKDKSGNKIAKYQLSYQGWLQLAMRSGLYKKIKILDVRQGEYAGMDPSTGEPKFNWEQDYRVREKLPLEGIYAYYTLENGFENSIYWSHEQILDHANRYSQSFKGKKELYKKMCEGKEPWPTGASPWFDEPLSTGHLKMCKKTVIIQLFSDGIAPLSVEMRQMLREDQYIEAGQEIVYDVEDEQLAEANSVDKEKIVAEQEAVIVEEKAPEQMTLDDMK